MLTCQDGNNRLGKIQVSCGRKEEHGRNLRRRSFGKTLMEKLGCKMTHIEVGMSKEEKEKKSQYTW
jgi:hypothetical protein